MRNLLIGAVVAVAIAVGIVLPCLEGVDDRVLIAGGTAATLLLVGIGALVYGLLQEERRTGQ